MFCLLIEKNIRSRSPGDINVLVEHLCHSPYAGMGKNCMRIKLELN